MGGGGGGGAIILGGGPEATMTENIYSQYYNICTHTLWTNRQYKNLLTQVTTVNFYSFTGKYLMGREMKLCFPEEKPCILTGSYVACPLIAIKVI